jgi:flavin reductase
MPKHASLPTAPPTKPTGPSQDAFRNAMARLGGAVNIVTTNGPAGQAGFTASAVCSVSDTPPVLLVCLNRSASVYKTFKANQLLCVNTLAHGQEGTAAVFGGKTPMAGRFATGIWLQRITGAPVLQGALACFDCKISETVEIGTHDVMFCSVLSAEVNVTGEGLIYFDRRFHRLPALKSA